jgi:tRNA (mo5U34)-methyltransferase
MAERLTADEKRRLVATRTDWFHSIDVGDGIITPGLRRPADLQLELDLLQLPDDMRGLRVLDVGAYDGFFAFECERRGADVVAIDLYPEGIRCLELAKRLRGSAVKYRQTSIYNLQVEDLGGQFDLVLCLGVFYHLRHLFVALDSLWHVTRGELRVETHVIDNHFILGDGKVCRLADIDRRLVDTPIYRFYRFNELNGDYSNWFGANVAAVLESLSSAGFTPALLGTWDSRAAFRAQKNPAIPREWEIGSHEGTRHLLQENGSWTSTWKDPAAHGLPNRAARTPSGLA